MSYCPKCGNKVDETMTFCPRCGNSLKVEAPAQTAPAAPAPYRQRGEKSEKNEKHEKQEPEKGEKHEKGEHGFVGWLVGGLIMIVIGFFALLRATGTIPSGYDGAYALLIVGVIVIVAAVYLSTMARRRSPSPT